LYDNVCQVSLSVQLKQPAACRAGSFINTLRSTRWRQTVVVDHDEGQHYRYRWVSHAACACPGRRRAPARGRACKMFRECEVGRSVGRGRVGPRGVDVGEGGVVGGNKSGAAGGRCQARQALPLPRHITRPPGTRGCRIESGVVRAKAWKMQVRNAACECARSRAWRACASMRAASAQC